MTQAVPLLRPPLPQRVRMTPLHRVATRTGKANARKVSMLHTFTFYNYDCIFINENLATIYNKSTF